MNSRELIKAEHVIGYLMNRGDAAMRAYRERADLAKARGMTLIVLESKKDNLERIKAGDLIQCRYWDGTSLIEAKAPLPTAFYDRTGMASRSRVRHKEIINALLEKNTNFINSPGFRSVCSDKWLTYQILKENNIPTPNTVLYSAENLDDLIDKTGFVFIKKRVSSEGKGQVVIREHKGYYVRPSSMNKPFFVEDIEEVVSFLKEVQDIDQNYIIQEGVNVDDIQGRVYDFRALFQRSKKGNMGMTTFYVRVGAERSEQANIGKSGHPQDPYVMFEDYKGIEKSIRSMGQKIIHAFSKAYVVGEVGLDFVHDKDGNLLAIEANTKPGSKGLRTLREWVPTDEAYLNKAVIPFEYNNNIRRLWGRRLNNFLCKPLYYAQFLDTIKK